MSELVHQGAERAKAREAKWLAQTGSMTAREAAKLESELRSDPDDVVKREELFAHYLLKKDWPKLNPHLLWAIDHQKNEPGASIASFIPDPAVNRQGL